MYKCEKGKALTVGLLFAVVLLLASVWVVAYNFVPGGTLTREKNDIIMIVAMVAIGKFLVFVFSGTTTALNMS